MRVPTWMYVLVFVGLLIGNVKVYQAIFAPPVLEVTKFDVGKGSAILVRSPSGKTLLIDTGSDASILRALGVTLPMWQRKIDVVILTSTKSSSVGGLPDVQRRYHISQIMRIGSKDIPYGIPLLFDGARIEIFFPEILSVFYGSTSLAISSSTPAGVYISDGVSIK